MIERSINFVRAGDPVSAFGEYFIGNPNLYALVIKEYPSADHVAAYISIGSDEEVWIVFKSTDYDSHELKEISDFMASVKEYAKPLLSMRTKQ